jgi:hypothetical protein
MINVNAFLVAESLLDIRQACTMFLSFIEMLSRYSFGNMLKFASCEQKLSNSNCTFKAKTAILKVCVTTRLKSIIDNSMRNEVDPIVRSHSIGTDIFGCNFDIPWTLRTRYKIKIPWRRSTLHRDCSE